MLARFTILFFLLFSFSTFGQKFGEVNINEINVSKSKRVFDKFADRLNKLRSKYVKEYIVVDEKFEKALCTSGNTKSEYYFMISQDPLRYFGESFFDKKINFSNYKMTNYSPVQDSLNVIFSYFKKYDLDNFQKEGLAELNESSYTPFKQSLEKSKVFKKMLIERNYSYRSIVYDNPSCLKYLKELEKLKHEYIAKLNLIEREFKYVVNKKDLIPASLRHDTLFKNYFPSASALKIFDHPKLGTIGSVEGLQTKNYVKDLQTADLKKLSEEKLNGIQNELSNSLSSLLSVKDGLNGLTSPSELTPAYTPNFKSEEAKKIKLKFALDFDDFNTIFPSTVSLGLKVVVPISEKLAFSSGPILNIHKSSSPNVLVSVVRYYTFRSNLSFKVNSRISAMAESNFKSSRYNLEKFGEFSGNRMMFEKKGSAGLLIKLKVLRSINYSIICLYNIYNPNPNSTPFDFRLNMSFN